MTEQSQVPSSIATLAGGCFWCLEAVFTELKGVKLVTSGYSGGSVEHPSYKAVCTGDTGHAEVVQIVFDPAVISYATLLQVFFTIHDPTTLNRQGEDIGSQYRSAIFFHDDEQQQLAAAEIQKQAVEWDDPVVTELVPLAVFYPAEDYHQQYFSMHGHEPYCSLVVAPKVAKFKQRFASRLR
ncbi:MULTISPECIES: peptide-methionine (S)-S-oxide reductase MsrA [Corallincola]|uniref:Peptide methionine sulfoxide reductase MsrA n=2 Tax=Corallincola TaxID=1775176 RepID=A0ABY1WPT0_9GAMM|nr:MULTISPECIES: peptide-methionine (S)-S-oxide reductase MsrA [Corallincola]TAA45943.1 peptide-methionine (S)-S-oxide reductase [Corallincola spongiicola]TCI04051.1 peptide-methionine (S)-S-oxide reductase [Corallincola luteus]